MIKHERNLDLSGMDQISSEPLQSMSKRLATYLPDGVYEYLEAWASKEKRSISNLAAFLLEQSIRERMEKKGENFEEK